MGFGAIYDERTTTHQRATQSSPENKAPSDEPRVIGLNDDVADRAFETLAALTTRTILSLLYDQPLLPTEIHETLGTTHQNVQYHLAKLEEADLIEPAGVEQLVRGTDMTKYAPAKKAVVLVAGAEAEQRCVRDH